jgi:CheY-like chemotaxis protein
VRDGAEALEVYEEARQSGRPFDTVILDLTIPGGMGGLETMKRLRASDPSLKAVVSSGYSSDPVLHDYESFGFKGALSKPYTIETLGEMIDAIIKTEEG